MEVSLEMSSSFSRPELELKWFAKNAKKLNWKIYSYNDAICFVNFATKFCELGPSFIEIYWVIRNIEEHWEINYILPNLH